MIDQHTKNPLLPKAAQRYRKLAIGLLFLLALTAAAGYWLLYSASGLQSAAAAANRWGGGMIRLPMTGMERTRAWEAKETNKAIRNPLFMGIFSGGRRVFMGGS